MDAPFPRNEASIGEAEMKSNFSRADIVSNNWKSLAEFYIRVFDYKARPPEGAY
jgi:hypothetical protein